MWSKSYSTGALTPSSACPAPIKNVVVPLEPPWPPVITNDEAKKLAEAMARGERNRAPIGLTVSGHAVQEFNFSESPFGLAARVVERLTGHKPEPERE